MGTIAEGGRQLTSPAVAHAYLAPQGSLLRPAPRRFPATLFFTTLLIVTSRGLLEITIGKTLAYAVQAGVVALFIAAVLMTGMPRVSRRATTLFVLLWLLVIAALLSVFATSESGDASSASIYALVMTFLGAVLAVFGGLGFSFQPTSSVGKSLITIVIVMIVVALLQQFGGLTLFPGTDLGTLRTQARPSAMTGSFLHYPIALALLSFALLGYYSMRRRKVYLIVAIAGMLAVLVSYSRSGMVIVLVGLAVGVFLARDVRTYARIFAVTPLLIVAAALATPFGTYFDRFLSIFQSDGAGNTGRINAWQNLVDLWLQSPLLVGTHAGEYTNITSNLSSSGATASPESGVLQVLISLGLLGLIAFYGLMVVTVQATTPSVPWFRAGLIAAIVQSFVYQSIEVLPFVAIYAMFPLIASTSSLPRASTLQVPTDH